MIATPEKYKKPVDGGGTKRRVESLSVSELLAATEEVQEVEKVGSCPPLISSPLIFLSKLFYFKHLSLSLLYFCKSYAEIVETPYDQGIISCMLVWLLPIRKRS